MIPVAWAGAITIAALVGLGIFVYPRLLAKRGGAWVIAAVTVALVPLYMYFGWGRAGLVATVVSAVLWALAPVAACLILQRLKGGPAKS